ncbi:hypothetical protein [Streptomyces lydicamycinicus]|uniref:hypothetical protein n=1 Tax=Streptomyces lydicamycinicus TaxID=1546107 RepID=UPI003C2D1722
MTAGLLSRGKGAQVPSQVAAEAAADVSPADRLEVLEERIQASLDAYRGSLRALQLRHRAELGELLGEIADNDELVRAAGYGRFGDYVKNRWGWDRSYGYRLIDLAVVRRALAPLGPAVVDEVAEAHARVLAPVAKGPGGDAAARQLVSSLWAESDGKRVTAAAIKARRDAAEPESGLSPIGDSDDTGHEVVHAELVNDEAAEQVNRALRAAATAAETAVRHLDQALALDQAPFHAADGAQALSRIRSAVVRIQRRADLVPGR